MIDPNEFALGEEEFERIRRRIRAAAGIALSDAKRTLVIARLSKVIRALGLPSFAAYLDFLDSDGTAADEQEFVNALTTNLTRFWREEHHFSHLVAHVGGLVAAAGSSRRRLRIWSAGCSTGQEPYTIALSLLDAFPQLQGWDFRILATDVDTAVLARAATATYPEGELNGLAPERRRLFERTGPGRIRVPDAAARLVAFKPLNLIGPWPMRGPFDAIFCRNVAIYFDKETQSELFGRLASLLAPGGFLYVGHSENLAGGTSGLRLVGKTVYQPRAAGVGTRSAA